MNSHERHAEFISELQLSKSEMKRVKSLFEQLEREEERLGKPVEEMSSEELSKAVSLLDITRKSSTISVKASLKRYAAWCEQNGIGFLPVVSEISFDMSEQIRKRFVSSPADLKRRMDLCFDKEQDKSTHCPYRAFLWLVFMGIDADDAVTIRTQDVDLSVPCVFFHGIPYEIYPEAFPAMYVCVTATSLLVDYHDRGRTTWKQRAGGDQLLRGVSGNMSKGYIATRINQACLSQDFSLQQNNIYRSGVFYRFWLQEKETGVLDMTQYIQDKVSSYAGFSQRTEREQNKMFHSLKSTTLRDYENWKSALDIS